VDRYQRRSKSSVIAINVLSTTSSEKRVSREEAQHPDKVVQAAQVAQVVRVVVDSLASVDSLVAEAPILHLPQVQEDLGVEKVGSHPQILRRFSSKSS
jgi:hypothetical protein